MADNASIVRAANIYKTYRLGQARVAALQGVALAVGAGEFVALAGPSGSGKSTLLKLLGCLDQADTGDIHIGGVNIGRLSSPRLTELRRTRLGFVFQSFNLVPVLTARENVEYPLLLTGVPAHDRRHRVGELLKRVGLEQKASRRPHELSGGERQRIAIARALVNRPALVLADEPTANLDSATGAAVLDLMDELRDELGATFLFASHDPRLLSRMDRVIHLRDGRIAGEELEVPACA